ncbi:uncharacterized protein AB675_5516 [Cyphellophora attinorum]|uniref:Uncharacterized protein n=1 Tax=Cyphellophora attinorum TaxID=1664694 RepID=A0A0N1HTB4_9EURO|nr:uncharacterized protein AB675_5516 [Phialophora attinorum]KPI42200.1 hypothetical protein AB675_5516 [Phialophora attinorum]
MRPGDTTSHQQRTPLDHYTIRDSIWNGFESLKVENDDDRQHLSQSPDFKRRKGQLMEKLPIPWLAWASPTGQSGQTRHKGNFFALWDRIVAEYSRTSQCDTMFVSSILLPSTWHTEPFQQNLITNHAHDLGTSQTPSTSQTQHDPRRTEAAYESKENQYLEDNSGEETASETASDSSYETVIDGLQRGHGHPLTWKLPTRLK